MERISRVKVDGETFHGARTFTAGEVLEGWRSYTGSPSNLPPEQPEGRRTPGAPKDPGASSKPEPEIVQLCVPDMTFIQWLHVEKFFRKRFQWRASYPLLLMGAPTDCAFAFEDWYRRNPLIEPLAGTGYAWRRPQPDLVAMSLSDAVAWHNDRRKNKHRQVGYEAAKRAAQEGRLRAWQPKDEGGKWWTRPAEIERWERLPEARGGHRKGAGRKSA